MKRTRLTHTQGDLYHRLMLGTQEIGRIRSLPGILAGYEATRADGAQRVFLHRAAARRWIEQLL